MSNKLTVQLVKQIFAGLGAGKPAEFFKYVADDVKWTVTNPKAEYASHPLAGYYESVDAFKEATFTPLGAKLNEQLCLKMIHEPIVADSMGVVELQSVTSDGSVPTGKNGVKYTWIFEWDAKKEKIVRVRAYLDSAMVKAVMED